MLIVDHMEASLPGSRAHRKVSKSIVRPPSPLQAVYGAMAHPKFSDDIASKIIMQGIHIELTAAMQNNIREKFAVLLRHNERIIRINVNLHRDQTLGKNHHYSATGQIEISGPDLIATVGGDDAYNVIDSLVEKLDQQLRERSGRRKEKRNRPQEIEVDAPLPKTGTMD